MKSVKHTHNVDNSKYLTILKLLFFIDWARKIWRYSWIKYKWIMYGIRKLEKKLGIWFRMKKQTRKEIEWKLITNEFVIKWSFKI